MTHKFGVPVGAPGQFTPPANITQIAGTTINAASGDAADFAQGSVLQRVMAEGFLFNPATPGWEKARTPTKFNGIQTQSVTGTSTIWTPAAGKKFRLMGWKIIVSGNATLAVAAEAIGAIQDNATPIYTPTNFNQFGFFVPAAAGTGVLWDSGWVILPGNGYLSSAANNPLTVGIGGPAGNLTAGHVYVFVAGTEE